MRFFVILVSVMISSNAFSQKFYRTTGGELIFSKTVNNTPFIMSSSHLRMSAFLHFNNNYHYNFSNSIGIYSGLSVSNIGFIYESKDTLYKKRAYTLGIPIALKFGNLNNDHYLFAGGEIEIPFHYKQKKIFDDQKSKYSAFFDKRVNTLLPSVFAGIQFSEGLCFKVKLYLTDFLNTGFNGKDFGVSTSYKNSETQLFLLSLSYNLKQNKRKKIINDENRYAYLKI